MTEPAGRGVPAVVPSCAAVLVRARSTARSLHTHGVPCLVVDVDGSYRAVGDEQVLLLPDLVRELGAEQEAVLAAATLDPVDLAGYAGALGADAALRGGSSTVALLAPGVVASAGLLGFPDGQDGQDGLDGAGLAVVPSSDVATLAARARADRSQIVRREPDGSQTPQPGPAAGVLSRSILWLSDRAVARGLRALSADWRTADRAVDAVAVGAACRVLRHTSTLVTPWRAIGSVEADDAGALRVDGRLAVAVDLSGLDPARPWLLDGTPDVEPHLLLSRHPALAALVAHEADVRHRDLVDLGADGCGQPAGWPDVALRAEARRTTRLGGGLPDVLGVVGGPALVDWALEAVPAGDPRAVARYLMALLHIRPRLQQRFVQIPGPDARKLVQWAQGAASRLGDEYDVPLLERAVAVSEAALETSRARRAAAPAPVDGVNLVGYLAGAFGLGESARQVGDALRAAGVPVTTLDVSRDLGRAHAAPFEGAEPADGAAGPTIRRTSLICVNGSETAALMPRLRPLLAPTRVIGMWYWELEDFPANHRAGFDVVDEVWAATDFMREAIARDAGPVPVRTVMPPLPQAGPDRGQVPARLGLPADRPWFLFTFDYMSFAERKNPRGLVEAFTRAFAHLHEAERPALVIKTINADAQPGDAERLRLLVAGRRDVIVIEEYLPHEQRHVLAANCTAFVSLHRAEGLGLTVAEAMAWGRPVIVSGYGGVMQFCTPQNSLLVDCRRVTISETVGPYRAGMTWAEPDLDQAAALMRSVLEDPQRARRLGERAADDIRTLHNATVAGAGMRRALDEGARRGRPERAVSAADPVDPASSVAPHPPTGTASTGTASTGTAPTGPRRWAEAARRRIRG